MAAQRTDEKRSHAVNPTRRLPWPTQPTTWDSPAITTRRPAPGHRSMLRRIADAIFEWRQRKAERDIAAYIEHPAAA